MDTSSRYFAACAGVTASLLAGSPVTATDTSTRLKKSANKAAPYADGNYTAIGQYGSLPSSMIVRVQLGQGIIRHVTVGTPAKDPTSLAYQKRFAAAVPAVVTGKPIDEVRVGKLAGASGCPDGFNAAIAKIKAQAAR